MNDVTNFQVAITNSNIDKSTSLKKQNDELGYMFLPREVNMLLLVNWHSSVKPAVTDNQKSSVQCAGSQVL